MNAFGLVLFVGLCALVLAQPPPPPSASDIFDRIDKDENGALNKTELRKCARNNCRNRCLCNALRKQITGDKATVSLADLESYLEDNKPPAPPSGAPPPGGRRPRPPPMSPAQMIDCFDTNNDGGISKKEALRCSKWKCQRSLKRTCTGLNEKFAELDADGDDLIKENEIQRPPGPPPS